MMLFMPKGLVGRVGLGHPPAGHGRRPRPRAVTMPPDVTRPT